jgi:DNA-binding CsgD family transcriptional regulator
VVIRRAESDMAGLNNHVLHWRPEENRWVAIWWDDFCAFRELFTHSGPLADVGSGVHYFVVCICAEELVSPADLGLTDRQLDVLALMMQGKNNKSICRMLNLAEPTVKNHVTAILKALKVTNRTEAVIAVNEMGWKISGNSQAVRCSV